MTETKITDWDDAYANAAHIAGAAAFPERWAADAATFRSAWHLKQIDIAYGESPRQCLDVFFPDDGPKGLVVYVHGGYWLRFDKSYWSHFAAGCLASGWAVCLPGYDLAPAVRIADITAQIGAAVSTAATRVDGPIRLTGHSAGGHLVTRMVCEDTPLTSGVLDRVDNVVSISGLHDLRPLRNTKMNVSFQMSEADAVAESPALKKLADGHRVTAWVGGKELPEFIRQSTLLADVWPDAILNVDPERHHFDVIDGLKTADGALTQTLLTTRGS